MNTKGKQIILFDGVCNLCNNAVNFIIKHDKHDTFRYASLQSDIGKYYINKFNIDTQLLDSILLIKEDTVYYHKSSAALHIAKKLSGGYSLMTMFLIIPKPLRDFVYDYIAKNRYKWFGKKESCMLPSPKTKNLFLDQI